ncbi:MULTISPECIES: glucose 1-dehydrogenase [Pseudomonas]|uniref:Oxidoreductase n=1 Tax=Pseudomonas cichorii TaxID=36746 RepID=A0A3M4VZ45_PSECI|nr:MULTISPECIES: glucose 1-dehydrogenase [Pseudomonas]AHF68669.1 short-chain alcohol dehydrogenase-like protein [Pseudomonas cichorii JBC1]QVE15667.1 glucose 1-dehydrogenase [Pseudomonas cichorii]RMR56877.1 Short-chain alcohol dehydrogenase-like protein [Pseudomonas cichorii]SDN33892.1 3-oxoacyl-[acyl-carrier protein] reductase [Pseudomonas cichorii]GFM75753.1 oxidoreductase [Pseudomonas cichorii]
MKKLEGKVAVVTGASKGIGAGIAKALADDGASVVVNYSSSKAGADAVVDYIKSIGGTAIAVQGDVSIAAEAQGLIEAAVKQFGQLDVLVNNSGIFDVAPVEHVTEDQYRRLFDVNVLGVILTTQAAIKHLAQGGSVVNISSSITRLRTPGTSVYTATKAAVDAISGVLAKELAPRKIRVNVVSPGFVVTEGTTAAGIVGSDMEAGIVSQTPLGRAGQPEDIARVVAFLASDDARFVTGENITASGGL